MPEKTKHEKDLPELPEKKAEIKPENKKNEGQSRDRQEKSYYYDDSYGYEIYNPDEDDEEID